MRTLGSSRPLLGIGNRRMNAFSNDRPMVAAPAPITPQAPLPVRPFDPRSTNIATDPGVSNRRRGVIAPYSTRRTTSIAADPAVPAQAMTSQTSMMDTRQRRLFLANLLVR